LLRKISQIIRRAWGSALASKNIFISFPLPAFLLFFLSFCNDIYVLWTLPTSKKKERSKKKRKRNGQKVTLSVLSDSRGRRLNDMKKPYEKIDDFNIFTYSHLWVSQFKCSTVQLYNSSFEMWMWEEKSMIGSNSSEIKSRKSQKKSRIKTRYKSTKFYGIFTWVFEMKWKL
jgi:hypothetical protein